MGPMGSDWVISHTGPKEYLRVETDAEKRNLGQVCHALVCRRTEQAGSTMQYALNISGTFRHRKLKFYTHLDGSAVSS